MEGDPKYAADAGDPRRSLRRLRAADRPRGRPRRDPGRASTRAWDEALAADRPFVIDAVVDPEVPPLPPHITLEQAKSLHARRSRAATRTPRHMITRVVQAEDARVPARPMSTVDGARRSRALHDPDRRSGVRRHARVGLDHDRRRRGARGATRGLGCTYAPEAAGAIVDGTLAGVVRGRARSTSSRAIWLDCGAQLRNAGRPGSRSWRSPPSTSRSGTCRRGCSTCRSSSLLGLRARRACRSTAAAASARTRSSGSREQLGGWVEQGIPRVKMKLGREPGARPGAARRRARRDRRRRRAVRRRERRLLARSRRSRWARALRRASGTCAGSRSRSPRPTSTGCASCASGPAGSTSPPASTPTSPRDFRNLIGGASTACRPTSRAAAASPACCASNGLAAAHGLDLSATARRSSRRTRSAASTGCATSSTSTTTSGSSRCSSTACSSRWTARSCRTARGPATGSSSSARTRERWAA